MTNLKELPTDKQIREYIGVLGPVLKPEFIQGFISGWNARNEGFNPNKSSIVTGDIKHE